jgi:ElaB/YqjD/DUF883 family membrane-anchored ribosome-binding protein
MAEESGELKRIDAEEPVSVAAGAKGSDEFLEKYSENRAAAEVGRFETDSGDAHDSTDQIKARIEQTRNQMGETIDAIQERLSIANISDQVAETVGNAIETAKDTAYDATIGKAVNFMKNVGDGVTQTGAYRTVRSNPFPFALIGIGTGLLAYQRLSGHGSERAGNGGERRRLYDAGRRENDASGLETARKSVAGAAGSIYDGVADKASTTLESVSNVAGSAYENVSGKVGDAYAGVGEAAHRVYERAEEYGALAHEKYDEYLDENPLALGALAVAVGAAVGFAIPSTRYEGKLMGEARENLMQRAQDAAGSLVDKAKHVAAEAGETVKEEARALSN